MGFDSTLAGGTATGIHERGRVRREKESKKRCEEEAVPDREAGEEAMEAEKRGWGWCRRATRDHVEPWAQRGTLTLNVSNA